MIPILQLNLNFSLSNNFSGFIVPQINTSKIPLDIINEITSMKHQNLKLMNHQHFLKIEAKHPHRIFYLPHLPPCLHLLYLLHFSFDSNNLSFYALVSHNTNSLLVLSIETSSLLNFLDFPQFSELLPLSVVLPLLCAFKELPDVDPPKDFQ